MKAINLLCFQRRSRHRAITNNLFFSDHGVNIDDFSDEEDERVFHTEIHPYHRRLCYESYRDKFLPIKHDDAFDKDSTSMNELKEFCLCQGELGRLSNRGCERLAMFVRNNTHVETLTLHQCGLTDSKMAIFLDGLHDNRSIIHLKLSRFGPDGMSSLTRFMKSRSGLLSLQLRHVNLISFLEEKGIDKGEGDLVRSLEESGRFLEELDLHACNVRGKVARCFFSLVVTGDCYTGRKNEVDSGLNINNFNHSRTISSKNTNNRFPNLKKLSLVGNKIGKKECSLLVKLLRHSNSRLTELYLRYNELNDECALLLCDALRNSSANSRAYENNGNASLKILDLFGNDITIRGWEAFLFLLQDTSSIKATYYSNHSLQTLVFSKNYRHSCNQSKRIESFLKLALSINKYHEGDRKEAARTKIAVSHFGAYGDQICRSYSLYSTEKSGDFHHFEEINFKVDDFFGCRGKFDLSPFLEMELKLAPFLIAWVGRCDLRASYHLIKSCHDCFL